MKISLINAGKRFNRDWIFRNVSYNFTAGNSYAITGPNGSGKSTLLQVIGGALAMSEGEAKYEVRSQKSEVRNKTSDLGPQTSDFKPQPSEEVFRYISIAAPYLEVIEEMTVTELLAFHEQFKPFLPGITITQIITRIGLEKAAHKQIRYYSSGMKQRVKLAQAIFSDVSCVLLDEPCTNLDVEGIALYQALVADYCTHRLTIVSSNDKQEYSFCKEQLSILDFKM
jgi:ABC-type multidrug transport system ATPase subunit